jgi:hypothetical protein
LSAPHPRELATLISGERGAVLVDALLTGGQAHDLTDGIHKTQFPG